MTEFFRDYKEAHTYAVTMARQLGREVGLEKFKEFNTPGYRVFSLPKPAFRTGFELRCQVVSPDEPLG